MEIKINNEIINFHRIIDYELICIRCKNPQVYHMLQERTQYGIGRDNRVRGSWGPWSSWRECSRSCGTGVQSQARECVPARYEIFRFKARNIQFKSNDATVNPAHVHD